MTQPLFLAKDGVPALEILLQGVSGPSSGYREIIHTETLDSAVAATSPGIWDPKEHAEMKAAGRNRSLVVWAEKPKYAFVPGPACFGRIVTLHTCWVPPGHANPTKASEFRSLPGYEVCVFGGVGDPQFNRAWRDIPFSTARHRVVISNTLKIADPMKLAWYLESADAGDKKGTGPYFFLRVDGEVEVFGQYM